MTSQRLLNFQILKKWRKVKFLISKNMHGFKSLELSITVWSQYIALKLLWRIWESDVKEGPPFYAFLQIFYKIVKVLVLSYNLSHFLPISKKIDEWLAQS